MSTDARHGSAPDRHACAAWLIDAMAHVDRHGRGGVRAITVGDMARPGAWAQVAIDPSRQSPFPSESPNRALVLSRGQQVEGDLAELVAREYRSAGVNRFFVWVVPAEEAPAGEPGLASHGIVPFHGPDYLALIRLAEVPLPSLAQTTAFSVRELTADEIEQHAPTLASRTGQPRLADFLERTTRTPGRQFHHFAEFTSDDPHPVASASSLLWRGGAYLGWAATDPRYRGRGGQSALIAARVRHAEQHGCRWCMSETVSIGPTSLGNLERAGFRAAFTARVFAGRD